MAFYNVSKAIVDLQRNFWAYSVTLVIFPLPVNSPPLNFWNFGGPKGGNNQRNTVNPPCKMNGMTPSLLFWVYSFISTPSVAYRGELLPGQSYYWKTFSQMCARIQVNWYATTPIRVEETKEMG